MNNIHKNNFVGEYNNYYSVYNDDICIGCCGTNDDSNNMIYIYLDSEYRGNGLGTELFKEVLDMFNDDIKITIQSNNIVMLRIIDHYNPMILLKNDEIGVYQINRKV